MKRVLLALMTLVLGLLPGPAQADWSRGRSLDEPGWWTASGVPIAVARNGDALIAWVAIPPNAGQDPPELRARTIDASGRLGPLRVLYRPPHRGSVGEVSVAIDDDGDALVVWRASFYDAPSQVLARRLSRDGAAGPLVRVSDPDTDSHSPQAALTPGGRGAVVLTASTTPEMYTLSRNNRVGDPIYLSQSASHLVATRQGDFVAAGGGSAEQVVAYRLLPDGELLSRTVSADPPMLYNGTVDIGVSRSGTATITFQAEDDRPVRRPTLWTRTWARDGTLGPARRIAPRTHVVVRATSGTDLEGDTVIAWSHAVEPYRLILYSRILRRNGSLGPVHRLGPIQGPPPSGPRPAPTPELAIDDDGDGVVVWPSEPDSTRLIAWARRIRPDGSVGAKVMLQDMATPRGVGITPTGRARVALTEAGPGWLTLKTGP